MYEENQQRARPYGSNPQTARVFLHNIRHGQGSGRLVIFAVIAGLLGIVLGAASLTFMLSYRSTTQAQIHELQAGLSNAQQSAQSNTSGLNGLSGKVNAIDAGMAAIAPFSQVCSTDLADASGQPAQFWFACSDQRPGG